MNTLKNATEKCEYDALDPTNGQKDTVVQLVLSLALGVSAFIGFCVSRRRKQSSQPEILIHLDIAAKMEVIIRCSKATDVRRRRVTGFA